MGGVLNITAAAWTAGYHWWRSGNIMRMQNISKYMLVLALCLVVYVYDVKYIYIYIYIRMRMRMRMRMRTYAYTYTYTYTYIYIYMHCETKKQGTTILSITSPNVDRFSNFFH